ncbi:hypothetical protein D3C84_720610 [compost metagenome]
MLAALQRQQVGAKGIEFGLGRQHFTTGDGAAIHQLLQGLHPLLRPAHPGPEQLALSGLQLGAGGARRVLGHRRQLRQPGTPFRIVQMHQWLIDPHLIAGHDKQLLDPAGFPRAHFENLQAQLRRRVDHQQAVSQFAAQPDQGTGHQKQDQIPAHTKRRALARRVEHGQSLFLGRVQFFATVKSDFHDGSPFWKVSPGLPVNAGNPQGLQLFTPGIALVLQLRGRRAGP